MVFVLQAEACILSSLCFGAFVPQFCVVLILQAEVCILSSLCFGALVRLVLGGVRFAGGSLHS